MSWNLAKTPEAVRAGGGSMSLWVLRLFSATRPTSPFSAASARTDSSCRPEGVESRGGEAKVCPPTPRRLSPQAPPQPLVSIPSARLAVTQASVPAQSHGHLPCRLPRQALPLC